MSDKYDDRSVVVGVDLGTQGIKVVLYDFRLRHEVATARSSLALFVGEDGAREQAADWWLDGLRECFAALPSTQKQRALALAVSGQQHGLVALGEDGRVVAPVKLWNDTSTLAECDEIEAILGGREAVIRLIGNPILPGYTASKLLWLKKNRPTAYNEMRHILLPHDYLNYYFTGRITAEAGDASGTGFFDIRRRQWSKEVLRAIDDSRDLLLALPDICPSYESIGCVKSNIAAELGIPADVMVAVGGGDNMMAAIGTGAVFPGALTISLGTSGTLFAYAETPTVSDQGDFASFCSSTGGYLPLACSLNCTSATELVRATMGINLDQFDRNLQASEVGAGGIVALPFFGGERTPECPLGTGTFFGLTSLNTSACNLMRAVVEATVFSLRWGFESMQRQGLVSRVATVTGGGAHSKEWLQIIADVLDLEVKVSPHGEAAAFGAALQALWCLEHSRGRATSIADIVSSHLEFNGERIFTPQRQRVATYTEIFRRYQDLVIMMQARWAHR